MRDATLEAVCKVGQNLEYYQGRGDQELNVVNQPLQQVESNHVKPMGNSFMVG